MTIPTAFDSFSSAFLLFSLLSHDLNPSFSNASLSGQRSLSS